MRKKHRNPLPTVDIIIELDDSGIVLIQRKNPPMGWALPGGFVDYGESLEAAAVREAREETSLDIKLTEQFHTYSDPSRDPRHHTITTVYIASATGVPKAADDAREAGVFKETDFPEPLAFDHKRILRDYFRYKKSCCELRVTCCELKKKVVKENKTRNAQLVTNWSHLR